MESNEGNMAPEPRQWPRNNKTGTTKICFKN